MSQQQHRFNLRPDAEQAWLTELSTQSEGTANLYQPYFEEFCNFIHQTPDEILNKRIEDDTSTNKQIKRRYETYFREFLKHKRTTPLPRTGKPPMPKTMQTIYASIRSFFELHEYPLKMRRKDYPKGDSQGVSRATKQHILKVLDANPNNTKLTAMLTALNDTGLAVIDLIKVNCKVFLENPNAKIIAYQTLRHKTKDKIKTFFAEESITAIKTYLEHRRKGTRNITPETITAETPLFVQYKNRKPKRITRTNISSTISMAFNRTGEKRLSAHSIRKKTQTCLEKGNMPTNWIDQILGHQLINSRDAYSLPTDEELQEAYEKAYDQVRLFPKSTTITTQQANESEFAEAKTLEECKQLLLKGYKFEMNHNGTRLFRKPQTCKN